MEAIEFIHQNCLFYKDGHLVAGWIEKIQKKKLGISPLQGKSIFLSPHHVGVFWKADSQPTEKNLALEHLKGQMQEIQKIASQQELETIYALSQGGESYTLEKLAADFLTTTDNPLQLIGLFYAIEQDRRFFKKRGESYIARTAEELAQLEAQQKKAEQQREWKAKVEQWLLDIETGAWNCQTPKNAEQLKWIQQIQSVLVYGKNSGYWKHLAPIFHLTTPLNKEEENKLQALLKQVGSPISQGRLILLKALVQEEFTQECLEAALALHQQPILQSNRKLWQDLPTFTIDSEKTQDYDDAISILEWSNHRIKIAVHIADVSNAILPKNLLFDVAEQRIASVYTLKKTFPMLPVLLSNDYFSLKAGKERLAMSFVFDLFMNGESQFEDVHFSVICVDKNLTYEQVDQLIVQKEGFWHNLSQCCQALRQQRMEQGALDFPRKEVAIDISNPEKILIFPINRNTLANQFVEELAILVNQQVGKIFNENQIPGIYRVQGAYEMVKELKEGEPLTLQHFVIEPVRLSTIPERHEGLGCDYYIQTTSPIRRFADLLSQLQLAALLQGQPSFFQEEQLMGWAEQIQTTQRNYGRAEREIKDHWKFKYLLQHQGSVFAAIVKRHLRTGRTEVEFETIQLIAQVTHLPHLEPQKTVFLKIENVDVLRQWIVASVSSLTEEKVG